LQLLSSSQRTPVEEFLHARTLPADLDHGFVDATRQVLSGLQKVVVTKDDLRDALVAGGSPCTLAELEERFVGYLDALAQGKDRTKLRVVLE